jgi:hypothetical protein
MNRRKGIGMAGLCITLVCSSGALASAGTSSIHNGYYAPRGFGPGYSYVGLFVADNGRVLVGGLKGSGAACTVAPLLEAQDSAEFTPDTVISIHIPRNLPISANGSFSFSGDVTLTPEETQTSMTFTEPLTLTGTFTRSKVVANKTIAVRGRFLAPDICESATPTTYADPWAINDK